jgi:hypothetical protein
MGSLELREIGHPRDFRTETAIQSNITAKRRKTELATGRFFPPDSRD